MARIILETERLRLREFTPDDLEALVALQGDPEVMRFWPRPYTREEVAERLNRSLAAYEQLGYGLWAVELRETGDFVGRCGLLPQTVHETQELEIAYMIAARHWRRGYGSEAAQAIRDWAFTHLPVERLISLILPENAGSIGVARRNGMQPIGTHVHFGSPHRVFCITRAEWLALSATT